jgi:hypothetical protein
MVGRFVYYLSSEICEPHSFCAFAWVEVVPFFRHFVSRCTEKKRTIDKNTAQTKRTIPGALQYASYSTTVHQDCNNGSFYSALSTDTIHGSHHSSKYCTDETAIVEYIVPYA